MRSRDRLRARRRRFVLLAAAASLLGAGGTLPARAQEAPEAPAGPSGESLFGSYELEARGQGIQASYEIEGLLPGGTPVLDLGIPEALARFGSGPTGYGVASLAYPGGIIVNLPSLVEQGGGGSDTPPYPVMEEAFYPTGPTEAGSAEPGQPTQHVVTGDRGVEVVASYPVLAAPPAITIGSIHTAARSAIEEGKAISRTRVVASDVVVLGGVLSIDSVVTDLVSAHDGTTGSTSGGTIASGVRFLGLAASLTEDGLVLDEAPPVEGPGAPLGGVLNPAVPGAQGAVTPIQEALAGVLDQATPQLDEVLAKAGIAISIAEPREEQAEVGAASRVSSGLQISLTYEGREQEALGDLIFAIPEELKPNLGPIPNPISFLAENHITGISIAPASVLSLATPPFPDLDLTLGDLPGTADLGPLTGGDFGAPGFATPAPDLPAAPPSSEAIDGEPAASILGGAVPAILVALALFAAPFFGLGSTRLADAVLAPAGTSCPIGLDQPPPPARPS
jgi:hypothetical protein